MRRAGTRAGAECVVPVAHVRVPLVGLGCLVGLLELGEVLVVLLRRVAVVRLP